VAPVIGATLAIPIFRVLYMSEQRGVGP
jgi:hypothetical protein